VLNPVGCRALRLKTIRSGKWDLSRGIVKDRKVKIKLERCGQALYSETERKLRICNACFIGWQADGNQLVTKDVDAEICPTCKGKSVDPGNKIVCLKCENKGYVIGG